jgi:RsiW-degrading membrane proteinase PrsW (M82 family)
VNLSPLPTIAAAALPGAILFAVLAARRPLRSLFVALVLGALSTLPAILFERAFTPPDLAFPNLGAFLLFVVLAVAAVEEGCKLGAVWLGLTSRPDFEEYDAVVYGACVAIGFATTENIAYCLHLGPAVALPRALTAVPAHVIFGVILGAAAGRARARERVGWDGRPVLVGGFLVAVCGHSVYDAAAFVRSTPALVLLGLELVAGLLYAVYLGRLALARSPSYGGRLAPAPPAAAPRRLERGRRGRSHVVAGIIGFFPGLGQLYLGQPRKAAVYLGLALFNGGLLGLSELYLRAPGRAASWAQWVGLHPALSLSGQTDFSSWLPPLFLVALIATMTLAAIDASMTAVTPDRPFDTTGPVLSYLAHISLIVLIVFAPIVPGGAPRSEQATAPSSPAPPPPDAEMQLTWVKPVDIDRVNGWKARHSPAPPPPPRAGPSPLPTAVPRARVVVKMRPPEIVAASHGHATVPRPASIPTTDVPPRSVADGPSIQGVPTRQRTSSQGRKPASPRLRGNDDGPGQAPGPRSPDEAAWFSYNQYLTWRFHEGQASDPFFKHTPVDVWVIARYEIDADGTLLNVEVVDTSGTSAEAETVVRMLRTLAPFRPLPGHRARISITELFWKQEFRAFPRGSLAESLSRLPDGRLIRE